jgi:hypothetical protein
MQSRKYVKMQTYCPAETADQVRLAIGRAGGGVVGDYRFCSFTTPGVARFLPTDQAHPTIGTKGELTQVEEIKIEFRCEKTKVEAVIAAIKKAHPYEQVEIDIFEILDSA